MIGAAIREIILFDIPGTQSAKAWSGNTWKTRLVLNYKRIPYRTEWVSYPDIASTFEKRGIPPSEALENGKPYYTCPAIIDLNGKPEPWKVSDSMTIAEYLEDTYSDPECGPKLFPEGTKEAQLAFIRHLKSETIPRAWRLVVTLVPAILDSRGREYYCSTREETVGAPLAEFGAAGTTQREEFSTDLKEAMDDVAAMYDRNEEGGGEYFTRETITDGPHVKSAWDVVKTSNGGRWERLMNKFQDYLQVH